MQHSSDDDLVLHYYGELPSVEGHLGECADCRERYRGLQSVLNAVELPVPEQGRDYEARVWSRLAPEIGLRRRSSWFSVKFWLPATAALLAVLAAFMAGRWTRPERTETALAPTAVRERVLIVAVGDHLERSQMVIAELLNATPGSSLTGERDLADSLVGANRLYRQTAASTGDTATASLLEDLERVLIEIAHAPDAPHSQEIEQLRERVQQQGLLFRLRVTGTQLREKLTQPKQAEGSLL